MQCVFLGQSGFLFEDGEYSILIDPYFSDSVAQIHKELTRKVPVDETYLKRKYDFLCLSHSHLDHTDPETIKVLLQSNPQMMVAGPETSWSQIRDTFPGSAKYLFLQPGGAFSCGNFLVEALPAYHSDSQAIGFMIRYKDKNIYVSGDTCYTGALRECLCQKSAEYFCVCINGGVGNNMNVSQVLRLMRELAPRLVVPCHFDMFQESIDFDGFMSGAKSMGIEIVKPEAYKTVLEF